MCMTMELFHLRAAFQSHSFHVLIVFLTLSNVLLLLTLLIIDEVERQSSHPPSESLVHASEGISIATLSLLSFFMLEIILTLIAFGPGYYWKQDPAWRIHLFDAIVVIVSFALEVSLHGSAQQFASLLIIFRLWRILKLVTITSNIMDERTAAALAEKEKENLELRREISRLQNIIDEKQGTHDETKDITII